MVDIQKEKIAALYDIVAATYHNRYLGLKSIFYDRVEMAPIMDFISLDGADVLDCGTGTGRFAAEAAKKARSAVGIDISKEMIKEARKRFGDIANLKFYEMDSLKTDFPDGSFDVIAAIGIFEYVEQLPPYFEECRRLLRPGGMLVFTCHNAEALRPTKSNPVYPIYRHSLRDLESELESTGFKLLGYKTCFFLSGRWIWGMIRLPFPFALKKLWVGGIANLNILLASLKQTGHLGRELIVCAVSEG
jgi:ubiquinone/menaquinone biosynthesis C-methylase UbiE